MNRLFQAQLYRWLGDLGETMKRHGVFGGMGKKRGEHRVVERIEHGVVGNGFPLM